MAKVKVEIEIPDGYELKYQEMRVPCDGELFAWDGRLLQAYFDFKSEKYPIVQPITTPWEWPVWLKAPWIAMNEDGDWDAYQVEPEEFDGYWVGSNSCWLDDRVFDITFPPVTDWKKSKMKNPRGGA